VRLRAFISAIAIGLISGIAVGASLNLAVGRAWNANPQMALVILVVMIGASIYEMWCRLKVLNG
jgi:F0F1-type ATP synthase assembly protein I